MEGHSFALVNGRADGRPVESGGGRRVAATVAVQTGKSFAVVAQLAPGDSVQADPVLVSGWRRVFDMDDKELGWVTDRLLRLTRPTH